MFVYIILGIVAVAVLWGIMAYNSMVQKRNQIDNALGSVDAMLKKRYDLIPNLIETVKQYMMHEASLLSDITRLRSQAINTQNPVEKSSLDQQVGQKLAEMMISVENYPNLKANQNFLNLQASLNETEEQISAARRFYNSSVTDFNNAIQIFPNSLIANQMGFLAEYVLETPENERKNVSVKEGFKG